MTGHRLTTLTTNTTISTRHRPTLLLYLLAGIAAAGTLAHTLGDQLIFHRLAAHLTALYSSVGKYGETTPLYGYLYLASAIGIILCWYNFRAVRRATDSAKRRGIVSAIFAAIPVFAPLVLREYGQPVIPISFAIGLVVSWLLSVAGLVFLRKQ